MIRRALIWIAALAALGGAWLLAIEHAERQADCQSAGGRLAGRC